MITEKQKHEILQLVEAEKERLGTYRAVANKCGYSETTISQLRKGTYLAEGDDVYETIALKLGYNFDNGDWKIVPIANFRTVYQTLEDSKNESMFMGISHKSGSGKTTASNVFLKHHHHHGAFKINCMEWGARPFLEKVAHEIGATFPKGYINSNKMIEAISATIKGMASIKPIIILDQANSLKPAALRSIIHLYNENEGILGVTVIGTDNLEYEIKRGVRLNKMGYDEIDSRLGRVYIHLTGANLTDTRSICDANGIKAKKQQKDIFDECKPVRVTIKDENDIERQITVVEDIRRIKRIIKREKLNMSYAS